MVKRHPVRDFGALAQYIAPLADEIRNLLNRVKAGRDWINATEALHINLPPAGIENGETRTVRPIGQRI